MTGIALAARRSALEVAGPVAVRAGVALGLWLLISLGEPATGG